MKHTIDETIASNSKLRQSVEKLNELLADVVGQPYADVTAKWSARQGEDDPRIEWVLVYKDQAKVSAARSDIDLDLLVEGDRFLDQLQSVWTRLLRLHLHGIVGDLYAMRNEEVTS